MRIVYLATADARGHLMRAQLLTHALRAGGAQVQVLTTSDDGARFLAGFGVAAQVLSHHYAVQFDAGQNMQRQATDANVAAYMFRPSRMLRDVLYLHREVRRADLVINDSFHPALLLMGCLLPWRRRVVHVYGASLRQALETNFEGRLPAWLAAVFRRAVSWQIESARARLEHDFAYTQPSVHGNSHRLPTPVAVVASAAKPAAGAAVYLNPHFRDPALAQALEVGLAGAGVAAHLVGEGYAARPGWIEQDTAWVERAACSALVVSAPGMAALSVALVYRRPLLLVVTEQPEQQINATRACTLGVRHRSVMWRGPGHAQAFAKEVQLASEALLAGGADEPQAEAAATAVRPIVNPAHARLEAWVDLLQRLARPSAKD